MILCRDIYHCLPSELDKEDWGRIQGHIEAINAEARVKKLRGRKPRGRRGKK